MYLNGIEKNSDNPLPFKTGSDLGQVLTLGRAGAFDGSYFNGSIDDVMIFNRSLSVAEVSALYANQSTHYLEANFTSLSDGDSCLK